MELQNYSQQNTPFLPQYFHKEFYQKALLLQQNKQFDVASIFFLKCIESQEPNLDYYKDAASCFYTLKLYEKTVSIIELGLDICKNVVNINTNNYSSSLNNMYVILYISYKCIGEHQKAEQIYPKFQDRTKPEFKLIVQDILNRQIIPLEERKEQAKFVYEQLNNFQLPKQAGVGYYIIPMKWFENWKAYTQFDSIFNEEYIQEENTDIKHPGPLVFDDLILNFNDQIYDPSVEQNYTNFILKPNLQENKDFVIVNASIARKLHESYNGTLLSRLTVLKGERQEPRLEISLKQIKFFILPSIFQDQNYEQRLQYKIQASEDMTVLDLQKKIQRILSYLPLRNPASICDIKNIKIWKIKNSIDNITNKYFRRDIDTGVQIDGNLLNINNKLEDSQICDEDILLVEFKQEEGWIFQNLKQQEEDQEEGMNIENLGDNLQNQQLQIICCAKCGVENGEVIKGQQIILEIQCSCKFVYYCSLKCQENDKKAHTIVHNSIQDQEKQKQKVCNYFKIKGLFNGNPQGRKGLVGLQNLGNTCFMNTSLQCLSNCYELTQYFLNGQFLRDMNTGNPLGTKGWLAGAYYEMIQQLWQGSDRYMSPYNFKKVIGEFAPQFSGYSQQDSQELLSYVLDGLHEDLNRVKQKPILEQLESDGTKDNEIAQKSWKNYLKRNQSIITDLLVGQFKSTLNCPDCKRISVTFDPFMSISLPIQQRKKTINTSFYFMFRDPRKQPLKIELTAYSNTTKLELNQIMKKWNPKIQYLRQYYFKNLSIDTYVSKESTITDIDNNQNHMFMMQTFDQEYEDFDQNNPILIELQIFKKEQLDKPFSFSRVFHINSEYTFQKLYVSVYRTIRKYIQIYFEHLQQTKNEDPPVNIDLDDYSFENVQKELQEFQRQNKLPFTLTYEKYNIKYDDNDTLFSKLTKYLTKSIVPIKLTFSNYFDLSQHKMLKINTCETEKVNQFKLENNDEEPTIYNSLKTFIKPEILGKGNEWYCSQCQEHKCAQKTMQIQKLPKYLILHLKRFKTGDVKTYGRIFYESGGEKIKTMVQCPLKDIDLTEYVLDAKNNNEKYIYDVIGVSNHSGTMQYGHYTAYAKSPLYDEWYDYNDSSVSKQNENSIITDSAYVLFLKRKNV